MSAGLIGAIRSLSPRASVKQRCLMKKLLAVLILVLAGCTGIPEQVTPVEGFEVQRYLGRWYEIARLDHSFERGLTQVTADYSSREDGGIRVVNRGYDPDSGSWREVEGKAYFVSRPDLGRLKVSFFGPFYGGYNIFELDHRDYSYSLVCGPDKSYLWILAREPTLDPPILERLVRKADSLGFPTERLIYPQQP
jgi:apolipoprotein D and lipocalin family protein